MIHKKLANGFSDLKESFTDETKDETKDEAAAAPAAAAAASAAATAAAAAVAEVEDEDEDEFTSMTRFYYVTVPLGCIGVVLIFYLLYMYIFKSGYASEYLTAAAAVLFLTVVGMLLAAFVEDNTWAGGSIVGVLMVMGMVMMMVSQVDTSEEARYQRSAGPRDDQGKRFEGYVYPNKTTEDRFLGEEKMLVSEYRARGEPGGMTLAEKTGSAIVAPVKGLSK